jgi:peptide deformylase
MIVKHATQIGNPVIRRRSKVVPRVSAPEIKRIAKNLIDSLRYHGLVGMAAPQIGINLRIFVTEIRKTQTRNPKEADAARVFINPKIVKRSRAQEEDYEGCGSVAYAGLFASVARSRTVTVEAFNEKGKKFTLQAAGLLARVIQHENDHLDGIVFLDRLPDMESVTSREELI